MNKTKKALFSFFVTSLLALSSFTISMRANSDPLKGLDDYIRKSMADWQVPGLAIAIVKDDAVVFMKGYGFREVGKEALVNVQTIFALGSATKSFTAHAVALLVDEGKVSWDDPVIKHLPWFQLPDPWVTREVTVRDLLAHRVAGDMGIPGTEWGLAYCGSNRIEVLKNLRYFEPGKPRFRSEFIYSNEGYMTAGEVVAAASGMSWEEFIKTHIFDELGMNSATTKATDLWDDEYLNTMHEDIGIKDAKVSNIVMGHYYKEDTPLPMPWWNPDNAAPAASICMNIEDWVKWVQLMIGKGLYNGKRMLNSKVIEEMHTAQIVLGKWWINNTPPIKWLVGHGSSSLWAMGLGWWIGDYRGRKILSHGGGNSGCLSFHILMPEEKLGIAVLTNAWAPNRLPWALPFKILDAYLGGPDRDWSSEILQDVKVEMKRRKAWEKFMMKRVKETKPSLSISDYVGTYTYKSLFEQKITLENEMLVLSDCTGDVWDLEHWHYDTFRATARNPTFYTSSALYVNFVLDTTGRIAELKFQGVVFKRGKAQSKE
jgi:CubicO group peptidase (beta-lactamase class C family)